MNKMKFCILLFLIANNIYIYTSDTSSTSTTSSIGYVTSKNFDVLKENLNRIRWAKEHKYDFYLGCHGTKDCLPGCENQWENDILKWYNNIRKELKLSTATKISKNQFDTKFINILKQQLEAFEEQQKKEYGIKEETPSYRCSIAGLDKKSVIKALFNAAEDKITNTAMLLTIAQAYHIGSRSKGVPDFLDGDNKYDYLNDSEIKTILSEGGAIDRLKGRTIKTDVSGDIIYTYCFNRDNGYNAAENAIARLRNTELIFETQGANPNIKKIKTMIQNGANTKYKDKDDKTFCDYVKDRPAILNALKEEYRVVIQRLMTNKTIPDAAELISEYVV